MAGRLAGKRILITAAGQGMGRATALMCAAEGADVLATDRDAALLEAYGDLLHNRLAQVRDVRDGVLLHHRGARPVGVHLPSDGRQPGTGIGHHLHHPVPLEGPGKHAQIHTATPRHNSGNPQRTALCQGESGTGRSTVRGPSMS